jgi:hypothetical protein
VNDYESFVAVQNTCFLIRMDSKPSELNSTNNIKIINFFYPPNTSIWLNCYINQDYVVFALGTLSSEDFLKSLNLKAKCSQ